MPPKFADVQNEYKKDSKLKPEDVKQLKEWVEKQPHLPNISELQTLIFLHSCYYSNEKAKTAIDTFFTVRTLCPEIFGNEFPRKKEFSEAMKLNLYWPLPKLTPEGYCVVYLKLVDNTNVDKFNFNQQVRFFDMSTLLNLYQNGTVSGHVIAIDFSAFTFNHFTKIGITTLKKFLYYLQEGMPMRLKSLHFFNIPPFIDKLTALIKPFLKKELFDLLFLHENVDGLTKFLPLECLPSDYGGQQDSIAVLHGKFMKLLKENVEYLISEEKMVVDESLRPGKPKNAGDFFGIEGTFKKLDID